MKLDRKGMGLWRQATGEYGNQTMVILLDGYFCGTMMIPPYDESGILMLPPLWSEVEARRIASHVASNYRKTKMADSNTYSTATEELAKLFDAAAVPERSALGELAEILKLAEPRQCSVWDEGVRLKWEGGLQKFAEKASLKTLDEAEFNLADAMLESVK